MATRGLKVDIGSCMHAGGVTRGEGGGQCPKYTVHHSVVTWHIETVWKPLVMTESGSTTCEKR